MLGNSPGRSSAAARQLRADDRDFTAINDQDDRAAEEHYQREREQQPSIRRAIGIDHHNAEFSQMAHNRAADYSQRQNRANRDGRRNQQQDYRYQFNDARSDPAPRFDSQFGENVNRLLRSREFEEEGLKENPRDNQSQNPTQDVHTLTQLHCFFPQSLPPQ